MTKVVVPWAHEARPDTRTTNVRLATWLFLASEAMFFGSLLSAQVLLRTGAASWPDPGGWVHPLMLWLSTALLAATTVVPQGWLWVAAGSGGAFVALQAAALMQMLDAGLHPASSVALACWFVLTGALALHAAGGAFATVWVAARAGAVPRAQLSGRLHVLRLYWGFLNLTWLAILVASFI